MLHISWPIVAAILSAIGLTPGNAHASPVMDPVSQIQISIAFNNLPYAPNCRLGWGFSCFIQGLEKHILFDTGSNGDILLYNMRTMHLRAEEIDLIVLSHAHFDHTGGLASVLNINPGVTICAPQDMAVSLRRQLSPPTTVLGAPEPIQLCAQGMTTGSMGRGLQEQALIIDLPSGLVIITGCAHPGVTNIVCRAKEISNRPVYLLIGGFHLMGHSQKQVVEIADELTSMGVQYVAPSHCTGDEAVEYFKQRWGERFVHSGCGAHIVINEQTITVKE